MASVTVTGTQVILNEVVIDNGKIAAAINKIDTDSRIEFIERAIDVYLSAIDISGEGAKIEFLGEKVKAHTITMMTNVEDVRQAMKQAIEDSEKRVKDNLEQSDDTLRKFLNEAIEKLSTFGSREHERSPTDAGKEYENLVAHMIRDIASTMDVPFRRVGTKSAKENRKGDCIVDFKEGRVVFEIKNRKDMSPEYVMDEISKAVKNHDANFGVFIARNVEDLSNVDTIGTLGEQYMACGMEKVGVELPGILKMVCQMACIKMAAKRTSSTAINKMEIERVCEEAKRDMIKALGKCTNIENAASSLKYELLKNVNQSLAEILKLVKTE